MLCDVCKTTITNLWLHLKSTESEAELGDIREKVRHSQSHHGSYESLCGAYRTCYICSRIHKSLTEHLGDMGYKVDEILSAGSLPEPLITANWWLRSPTVRRIVFRVHFPAHTIRVHWKSACYIAIEQHPISDLGSFEVALSKSTEISTCANIVQKWLKSCNELHPKCLLSRESHWLPTRLLDLQGVETKDHISLVLPDKTWTNEIYATLSHCWGGVTTLKLTAATLATFQSGIAIKQLPKTFIQAIKVALFLGVRYIWIDALTIIQDSRDDWEKEASLMGDVYRHAFINIGATASTDSHGGLFFERDPAFLHPPTYTMNHIDYLIIDRDQWDASIEEAPLLQRGWVTQERLLCSRMLHFAKDPLFWECRTSAGCEVTPEDRPDVLGLERRLSSFKIDDELAATVNGSETASDETSRSCRLLLQWNSIISFYSDTKLTFGSDRLIAVFGLARKFGRHLGDDYVAGMWKSDLVHGLAWYCRTDQKNGTSPPP
jgi:hypothetical protein